MRIFLDSADIEEITQINDIGIIDGVTTNPSLIAKIKSDFHGTIANICKIVNGDVSVEVTSDDYETMILQGTKLLDIGSNIVIKLPMTWSGLKACKYFSQQSIKTNMTLCFSVNQALLAAKAGAYYISPFVGRLDDIGSEGIELVRNIRYIYDKQRDHFSTKILAASIRTPQHLQQVALLGVDAVTIPGTLIKRLLDHPLTVHGLKLFDDDWARSGLGII